MSNCWFNWDCTVKAEPTREAALELVTRILKEEDMTIIPRFFEKKEHELLAILKQEYDIIVDYFYSQATGHGYLKKRRRENE